ncbi:MAG: Cof-type HAD-IIB family hydrolase [Eubacteriales bacterium]|nr:Cof-type HAD-IIB family hydrolase [Eubacteriales bacterium]
MGKFDGILICSDLDETLLTSERTISDENKSALEYFMSEGGCFTFATGRVPVGAKLALNYIIPNVPMICYNGAGIYDFNNDKLLWEMFLDKEAGKVIDFVLSKLPLTGVEISTNERVYHHRTNRLTVEHASIEKILQLGIDYKDIPEMWKKVIFMVEVEDMPELRRIITDSEFADKFNYIQSYKHYYEILPKEAGKGEAMLKLADMLGIDRNRTIGIGDNENDISLVKLAGTGIAVSNAVDAVKDVADYITVDNDSHALAAVIKGIENGKIIV